MEVAWQLRDAQDTEKSYSEEYLLSQQKMHQKSSLHLEVQAESLPLSKIGCLSADPSGRQVLPVELRKLMKLTTTHKGKPL